MVLFGYQLHYVSRLPFVAIWRILFKIREIQNTSTLPNLNVLPLLPQPFLDMHLSSHSLSRVSLLPTFITRIPTVKLKNSGKAGYRTSVSFKLQFLTLAINQWQWLGLSKSGTMEKYEKRFLYFSHFFHGSVLAKSQPLPLVDS